MKNANATLVALQVRRDELLVGALEPGCPHAAFGVPDRAEAIPLKTVPPHRPVLDQLSDRQLVEDITFYRRHFLPRKTCSTGARRPAALTFCRDTARRRKHVEACRAYRDRDRWGGGHWPALFRGARGARRRGHGGRHRGWR